MICFSGGFVWYYKTKDEPAGVTNFIGFSALFITLLSLFLIPVDVYMVSSGDKYIDMQDDIKYAYYGKI